MNSDFGTVFDQYILIMNRLYIFCLLFTPALLTGQIPGAPSCADAPVLCQLHMLEGFYGSNELGTSDALQSLCPEGGTVENVLWWAFNPQSTAVILQFNVENCRRQFGLQLAIYEGCNLANPIYCRTRCFSTGTELINLLDLNPCATYYMAIDGCLGDICHFSFRLIDFSPAPDPIIGLENPVNNWDTLCALQPTTITAVLDNRIREQCIASLLWTLNGDSLAIGSDTIPIAFSQGGDYEICLQGFRGLSHRRQYCDTQRYCKKIYVRHLDSLVRSTEFYCHSQLPLDLTDTILYESGVHQLSEIINGAGNCPFYSAETD